MNEHNYAAGTTIFRLGDPAEHAFLIRSGFVELLRDDDDGKARLSQYGPGEVFGEMSLIEERPHTLTARAVTAVTASALTSEEFERLLTSDPSTFRLYLKALFERFRGLSAEAELPADEDEELEVAEPELAPLNLSVTIHPLTHRAAETLPYAGLLIPKFPFRIGRASDSGEREALDLNDLWLLDEKPFQISRNHCVIDLRGTNVFIKDRGTSLGLIVNQERIGGHLDRRQVDLLEGDNVVVLGGPSSLYQFRIHLAHG